MSFLQLASIAKASRNSSAALPFTDAPSNLLETFIPGYSTIVQFLHDRFSTDINSIVTFSIFAFALGRSASYLKERILTVLMQHATCSVEILAESDQYDWIMAWLAERRIGLTASHLIAISSNQKSAAYNASRAYGGPRNTSAPSSAKPAKEQKYEPALSQTQYFWYKGRLFLWHRKQENQSPDPLVNGLISCVTFSTAPIKDLIEVAKTSYYQNHLQKTSIRRPSPRSRRNMGMNHWKVVSLRPSRPLSTVVLGSEQKEKLVEDIGEYSKPGSREWYLMRGIPYRRGYLLFGPSGTGKTSLAFGVAGRFNLDVYCISLAEPSISEEDLVALFDELPESCLVLLEDVDSAGLVERGRRTTNADATLPSGMYDRSRESNAISLSGLLNVIDGVASHEGRVLIMTTNCIDSLDSALLRPGRVDVRIRFELATRKQAEDLFLQIFVEDKVTPDEKKVKNSWNKDNMKEMACAFASEIPEKGLSPAELQGFLLNWKHEPAEAVARVKEWVEETLKDKEIRSSAKQHKDNNVPTK